MEPIGSDRDETQRLSTFRFLYMIVQLIGLALIVSVSCWIFIFMGGLSWSSTPSIQFNWHPLLMTIGMIYLYGNSILIYRGFRFVHKRSLKITHASIFGVIMLLLVFASWAVYDSHVLAKPPIPNLYSLHSWVGLTAVLLFFLQWIGGFFSFLYSIIPSPMREKVMPYHIYFGSTGYILALAAALLGISEKAQFRPIKLTEFPAEGILINIIGLLVILFGATVFYLSTNKQYKRLPLPEDTILLTGHDE